LTVNLLSPDQPDAPLGSMDIARLKTADVVFSTLGEADLDDGQFAAAAEVCRQLGKPVLNPPVSVLRTGRDRAAALFGDIPGLVAPEVRRMTPPDLAALPIEAPLLLRPVGDHGGENLALVRDDAEKRAWLAANQGDGVLVMPFLDFRSADGHWRKYRLIFVDRRVWPFHLAICDDWLAHYWRAGMRRSAWKKAEEAEFLADWRAVFGAKAALAAEEIARRLDLDYGGIDCALTRDGTLVLFEANACMLLHLDEPEAAFPYKHRHVPLIRDAFTRMVLQRAGNQRGTV
jgi:glutathione synthase/RimK-type ligase-like ATP-grasp enzyme